MTITSIQELKAALLGTEYTGKKAKPYDLQWLGTTPRGYAKEFREHFNNKNEIKNKKLAQELDLVHPGFIRLTACFRSATLQEAGDDWLLVVETRKNIRGKCRSEIFLLGLTETLIKNKYVGRQYASAVEAVDTYFIAHVSKGCDYFRNNINGAFVIGAENHMCIPTFEEALIELAEAVRHHYVWDINGPFDPDDNGVYHYMAEWSKPEYLDWKKDTYPDFYNRVSEPLPPLEIPPRPRKPFYHIMTDSSGWQDLAGINLKSTEPPYQHSWTWPQMMETLGNIFDGLVIRLHSEMLFRKESMYFKTMLVEETMDFKVFNESNNRQILNMSLDEKMPRIHAVSKVLEELVAHREKITGIKIPLLFKTSNFYHCLSSALKKVFLAGGGKLDTVEQFLRASGVDFKVTEKGKLPEHLKAEWDYGWEAPARGGCLVIELDRNSSWWRANRNR